ncbi:ribosomal protein L11 methyltransferase [Thermoanaerobacterium thermosaccharolyticum DSM 571]|uniref:Ribosomal protein L11 methyltransferase n=1 Tax=Thermoanaerobacterium thermosaccharolyticum (strain ATCC 7956 / DSM 571 / NCIMB 9385 / NCA 3814 / NCTC 13789 / WDCM 00135 / 2032) TaxID=580327 RepID=D9TP88_THETC|nr:50S ribosomal protein L11 methyltransferase [Thermoanaerobacterium thermosaccharolyticum]ADL68707.1 ribosomal protein L11 methyltransferase [Thermoanaerobacterium thermosaccharolyticum DSM 571]
MKWLEVKVTTSVEAEEAITNIMHEIGAGGVVIEDPNDLKMLNDDSEWDYVDPDMIVNTDKVVISAYFPLMPNTIDKVSIIKDRIMGLKEYNLDIGDFTFETSEVDDDDWANSWKKYYKPFKIGKRVVIKPSWEDYKPEENEIVVELDPGMAFGTGSHETTKMCIEFLEDYVKPNNVVFDVGCGTGILSIVSSKLGAKKVYAVDLDDVAIKVASLNVKLNNLDNIEVLKSDLLHELTGKADLIVANIIADIIIKATYDIYEKLNENGIFISSGIIKDRKNDVLDAISKYFDIIDIKEDGEWIAILSKKK